MAPTAGFTSSLMGRNLLFILIDSLSADLRYGEQGSARTPVFDRLRQQGTAFNQAIAAAANTTPCMGSIMTGLYPVTHGLRQRDGGYRLTPACPTLAEILRRHGYQTSAMVAGRSTPSETGLDRGFDAYQHRDYTKHLYTEWRKRLDAEIDRPARYNGRWFFFLRLWEIHAPRYLLASFDRSEFGKTRYERALSSLDHEVGKVLQRMDLE